MQYRETHSRDKDSIADITEAALGWRANKSSLQDVLENYPGALAIGSGEICGFAYSSPLSSDILKVANVCVKEDCRGQGIGSRLLAILENQAEKVGYEALLFSEDDNWFSPRAKEWLEKEGYRSIYNADHSRLLLKEIE